jgi:hypothetical protein
VSGRGPRPLDRGLRGLSAAARMSLAAPSGWGVDPYVAECRYPRGFACDRTALLSVYLAFWGVPLALAPSVSASGAKRESRSEGYPKNQTGLPATVLRAVDEGAGVPVDSVAASPEGRSGAARALTAVSRAGKVLPI